MHVAVIGTGFIGTIVGGALARAGHTVTFGTRDPERQPPEPGTRVAPIADALGDADVVLLAVPGAVVGQLCADYARLLAGRLVVDATNRMGEEVANARRHLPVDVRYARAFNTLGGEVMADPTFADGPADMFFSAPEDDRTVLELLIADTGLRPVYLGEDREALVDALFRVWIALALEQGRGRGLALRVLER